MLFNSCFNLIHVTTPQKETLAIKKQLQESWVPIECIIKEIYLISRYDVPSAPHPNVLLIDLPAFDRTKDDPFEIRHVIPFGQLEGEPSQPHFETHPIPEKE